MCTARSAARGHDRHRGCIVPDREVDRRSIRASRTAVHREVARTLGPGRGDAEDGARLRGGQGEIEGLAVPTGAPACESASATGCASGTIERFWGERSATK